MGRPSLYSRGTCDGVGARELAALDGAEMPERVVVLVEGELKFLVMFLLPESLVRLDDGVVDCGRELGPGSSTTSGLRPRFGLDERGRG